MSIVQKKRTLQGNIATSVKTESTAIVDEHKGFKGLVIHFNRMTVKHSGGVYGCPETGATANDIESV